MSRRDASLMRGSNRVIFTIKAKGEGGIYEPMFAPSVVQTIRATCANQHVAVQSTAHAGVKSVQSSR
jgi:hypothetical protein